MGKNRLLTVLLIAALMIVAVLCIAACKNDQTYTVTFNSDGGSAVEQQIVNGGDKATKPADPTRDDYEFVGWYHNGEEYKFDSAVTSDLTLVAHWKANSPKVTYTVTFDTCGGSEIQPQIIEAGSSASKPADPTRYGYNFMGWYESNDSRLYDFDTPITKDITLVADWDEAQFTVTFDTDGGSEIASRAVRYKDTVSRPDTPSRENFYFEGWFVGDVKYDFESPIEGELTIKAKWSSASEIDAAFTAALAADYSNYTSEVVFTDSETSYANAYKRTDVYAYYYTVNGWDDKGPHDDHFVVFDGKGSVLAMYRLDNNNKWIKSTVSHIDFVLALNFANITVDDVSYSEGVYHVYSDSLATMSYALFARDNYYNDLDIIVQDGRISAIVGHIDDTEQIQIFTDFGNTSIEIPNIPTVTVSIETNDRELQAGNEIDIDELIGLIFAVKAEDRIYSITSDMVDLGGLNIIDPTVGEYILTLTFETWDGKTHVGTAKVMVQAYQGNETFDEIFAKDYTNATIMYGTTTFKRVGDAYTSSAVVLNNNEVYFFIEADNSITRYNFNGETATALANNNIVLPRLEMLFALNSELFEQVDDTNVYVAKNSGDIVELLSKTLLMPSTTTVNTLRDYSITLTVELGRVNKVSYSYYYVTKNTTATANNGTVRNLEYNLSGFGTTEIDIPNVIKEMRNPNASTQTALPDNKRYTI